MDMRSSFDSRDDRHAYVGYVFHNLSAFVVNLAPNAGIGNIAKRVPIDPNNEVAFCTRQYDDLVCSILRTPEKGIHSLRMVLCRESAPPAIAVKFDNQHAVGISHHLHGAIGTEVVSLMGLHSTLPGLLGFARNDIPDRSFNRIEDPPPLQLSSLSALGQNEKNSERAYVFRFAPEPGHCPIQSACLKGANPDVALLHSITS